EPRLKLFADLGDKGMMDFGESGDCGMSGCSQCESMLRDLPEAGVLYLAPQLSHTRGTLRRILWESGLRFRVALAYA
ncbi:MAG TPA: hypothetical protein VNA27_05695, partial [Rubrobacteraceae bacterium]|nr:hypothetical protein [Rubrobacteraceae bacterium]